MGGTVGAVHTAPSTRGPRRHAIADAAVVLVEPIDPALRSTTADEIETIDPKAGAASVEDAMRRHELVDAIVV